MWSLSEIAGLLVALAGLCTAVGTLAGKLWGTRSERAKIEAEDDSRIKAHYEGLLKKYEEALSATEARLQAHIASLEKKIDELKSELEDRDNRNQALEAENIRLRRHNRELQELLDDRPTGGPKHPRSEK